MRTFKPKSILRIVLCYCAFVLGGTVFFSHICNRAVYNLPPATKFLPGETSYYFDFEKRIQRYQRMTRPSNVILGSCYARAIGEAEELANLGLNGIRCKEASWFLSYCHPGDRVVFVFTLRDLITPDIVAHPTARFPFVRKSMICREILQRRVGFNITPEPAQKPIDYKEYYWRKKEQNELIEQYLDRSQFPLLKPELTAPVLQELSKTDPEDISIEPLLKLQRKHPDMLFVVSPTISFSTVENAGFGADLNHYMRLREQLCNMLATSDFSFVDLSNLIEPVAFYDCFHYKHALAETVTKERIQDALDRSPQPLSAKMIPL